MHIFDKRSLDADKTIDPINMKERIAEGPWHEGIDFGDDRFGVAQDTRTSTAASAGRSLFEICSRDDPKPRISAYFTAVSPN